MSKTVTITSREIKRMTTSELCTLLEKIDFDATPQAYMVVFNEIRDRKRKARRKLQETRASQAFYGQFRD